MTAGVLWSRSHWVSGCLEEYTIFSTRELSCVRGIDLVSLLYTFHSFELYVSLSSPPNAICIRFACAALLFAIAVIGRDVVESDAASVIKLSALVAPEEVCTCKVEVDADVIGCVFSELISLALVTGGAGKLLTSTSVNAMTLPLGPIGGVGKSSEG